MYTGTIYTGLVPDQSLIVQKSVRLFHAYHKAHRMIWMSVYLAHQYISVQVKEILPAYNMQQKVVLWYSTGARCGCRLLLISSRSSPEA